MKNTLIILTLIMFSSLNGMQKDAREKIVEDRVLLQCALGALSTKIFESFAIDTPETRTSTLEKFRLLLRNEAKSLANPVLLRKNSELTTLTKLNYTIKAHFKNAKVNKEMLTEWSRENGDQNKISFNQLSDLVSSRLK